MFRLMFVSPRIAPNTGNAIRTAAATGCELHLVEPLGFDLSEPKLRRAGLDYHDLASVTVHASLQAAWDALLPARVVAFTAGATTSFADGHRANLTKKGRLACGSPSTARRTLAPVSIVFWMSTP